MFDFEDHLAKKSVWHDAIILQINVENDNYGKYLQNHFNKAARYGLHETSILQKNCSIIKKYDAIATYNA